MIVVLSENRFSALIRSLENIPASTSDDEINHRLDRYATTLFRHLGENFGFVRFDRVNVQGTLGTFRATLAPCHDDESRNIRLQGLAMLDPVSVSLEEQDLPAFFVGMLLTAMTDAYSSYAGEVHRLTVPELDAALRRIGEKVAFSPKPNTFVVENESDAACMREIEEEEFRLFCMRSGLKVPGAEREVREAAQQAELERIRAANEEAYQSFRHGQ